MLQITILVTVLVTVLGAPQTNLEESSPGGRIVGGVDTSISYHPYIVSVLVFGSHNCGGSLISPTWVVSAAHCFFPNPNWFSIRAGSSFINSGGVVHQLSRIVTHPQYNGSTLNNDIVLLELTNPVSHPIARAISLPPQGPPPAAGTPALVTGWGHTYENGSVSNILQVVEVPIVDHALCVAAYENFTISVTSNMLCAGLLGVGGKDACQGDSGGPLVVNDTLIGIVSWGAGCARPETPGVYASVPYFRNWIREVTGL